MTESTAGVSFEAARVHFGEGRLGEAAEVCRLVLDDAPGHARAMHLLGVISQRQGALDAALDWIERAIAADESVSEFHNARAVVLRRQGRLPEALAAYHRAIALDPDNPNPLHNLATLLKGLGRFAEAAVFLRRALARRESAESCYELGCVLLKLGELDEAAAVLRQSIALRPGHASSYNNLGIVLQLAGDLDGALAAFRAAAERQSTRAHHLGNVVFTAMFHPGYDAAAQLEEQRRWNARYAVPLRPRRRPHAVSSAAGRPLRIGYLCGDFRKHVVGLNVLPLLAHHDRERFSVACFSNVAAPDAVTDRFRALATHWCDIASLDDDAAADAIRAHGVDILVDLTMHMADNRLLVVARRPAPVQVSFGAYPGSSGVETVDYRISDPYLDPPGSDDGAVERTLRPVPSFWCYAPIGEEPEVGPLPSRRNGVITFGCLNNFCKVNEGTLALWARVLASVSNSRLLLLAPAGAARARVTAALASHGIAASRVEFVDRLPRAAYLRQFNEIDICLDTLPYNGHTTSLDAYYMGVPVVTQVGRTVVGRAGYSQLMNLGLPELVAHSADDFVRIAARLAADPDALAGLREGLRARMERSPLMDAAGFARGIEAAYERMWADWCRAGTPTA